jgi:SSS family transporter
MTEPEIAAGLNYWVLLLYLGAMVGIGIYFARRQKTAEDFFLAGRNMPWLAVAVSIFASITSAVSFMGVPALVFRENISILFGFVVLPIVAVAVMFLFLPFYRRLNVTTTYEYVEHRFGPRARYAASGLFIFARMGWLGTVIYAPALALSAATGFDLHITILAVGLLGTLYTVLGGIEAVIWTDVVQFVVMMGGAVWVAAALIAQVDGGVGGIMTTAAESGHLAVYDWRPSLTEMTVGVVVVSYFVNFLHDYGVDQLTVQRLLTTKTYKGMLCAVAVNAGVTLAALGLLAFIGLGMYAYYQQNPALAVEAVGTDAVMPHYAMTTLPGIVASLLIASILAAAMSSVDSGINSLSTVIVNDFVRPLRASALSGKQEVQLARALTLGLGVFTTGAAFLAAQLGEILKAAQAFLGMFSGPVLALFLLGMLCRSGNFWGWCAGVALSVPTTYVLQNNTELHFIYYFPLSFVVCFAVAFGVSVVIPREAPAGTTVWDSAD